MKLVSTSLLTIVLATGLVSAASAAQQQAAMPRAASDLPSEAFTVSEQQVANFVDAYVAIRGIGQHYRARIKSAGDKASVPELQKRARSEMKNAIIASGLGLSVYKQIVLAANHDKALRSRISAAINTASQSQQTAETGR